MAQNNSLFSLVDTTTFKVSPVKLDFRFISKPSGKIELKESGILRNIKTIAINKKGTKLENVSKSIRQTISNPNDSIIGSDSISPASPLLNDNIALTLQDSTVQIVRGEKGTQISTIQNDWMVGVLLFALFLMSIVRFSFSKYLNRIFDSLINYQTSSNLFLEKNMRNLRGSIFLNLLFFVNLALFIVQYLNKIPPLKENNNIVFFFYCFISLVGLYAGKFLFIRFVGYIFNGIRECKEYLHTVFIFNKNLGVFLLPITISVPFIAQYAVPMLLNAGLVMAFVFYLFRLFRGLKILFRQHVSIFYMILYLCALEILPLLMIYKLLYLLV